MGRHDPLPHPRAVHWSTRVHAVTGKPGAGRDANASRSGACAGKHADSGSIPLGHAARRVARPGAVHNARGALDAALRNTRRLAINHGLTGYRDGDGEGKAGGNEKDPPR